MINWCDDCGEPFETDLKWKKKCGKCWLKWKHPKLYEKKYLMKEIQCRTCGFLFWDEAWKTLCHPCWLQDQKEQEREEFEEREQFK